MPTENFIVDAGHPTLAGHFPGTPIVPGVIILSEVVRRAQTLGHRVVGIPNVKFTAPLLPGESCSIALESGRPGQCRFQVEGGQGVLASGVLAIEDTKPA